MASKENDALNWRTAVDQKSGRTYWYHRITRESTWTRPQCLEEQTKIEGNVGSGYDELLLMLDGLGTPDVLVQLLNETSPELQSEALMLFLSCCIPSTVSYLAKEPDAIESLVAIVMKEQVAEMRITALKCLCSMASSSSSAKYFAFYQGWTSLAFQIFKWDDFESGIIYIMFICILMGETTSKIISSDMIEILQTWLIKEFFDTSVLSTETHHQTSTPSPNDSKLDLDILFSHSASSQGGISVLDKCNLVPLAGCVNHNQGQGQGVASSVSNISDDTPSELPALLLLSIFKDSFRSSTNAEKLLEKDCFIALEILCINSGLPQDIRDMAESVIEEAMKSSVYVRKRILRHWKNLSSDAQTMLQSHRPSAVQSESKKCNLISFCMFTSTDIMSPSNSMVTTSPIYCDVELRPKVVEGSTVWRMSSSMLWARCPGMREVLEDFWNGMNQETAKTTRGGLEISVDASDLVLSILVYYIHTGLLLHLSSPNQSRNYASTIIDLEKYNGSGIPRLQDKTLSCYLEVCRMAVELSITELEKLVVDAIVNIFACESSLTQNTNPFYGQLLEEVISLSEQLGLSFLHYSLAYFLSHGHSKENRHGDYFVYCVGNSVSPSSVPGQMVHATNNNPHNIPTGGNPSKQAMLMMSGNNLNCKDMSPLHAAVMESLQDVNVALNEDNDVSEMELMNRHPSLRSGGGVGNSESRHKSGLSHPYNSSQSEYMENYNEYSTQNIHDNKGHGNVDGVKRGMRNSGRGTSKSGGIYKMLLDGNENDASGLGATYLSPSKGFNFQSDDFDMSSSYDDPGYGSNNKAIGNKSNTAKPGTSKTKTSLALASRSGNKAVRGSVNVEPEEFNPKMHSLEPSAITNKMTPSQKRLAEMSKPKQLKDPKSTKSSTKVESVAQESTEDTLSHEGASAESVQKRNKSGKVLPKATLMTTANITESSLPSKESGVKKPSVPSKRPSITSTSNDSLLSDSTNTLITSGESNVPPSGNGVSEDVRASLQLLKKRPKGGRGIIAKSTSSVDESLEINDVETVSSINTAKVKVVAVDLSKMTSGANTSNPSARAPSRNPPPPVASFDKNTSGGGMRGTRDVYQPDEVDDDEDDNEDEDDVEEEDEGYVVPKKMNSNISEKKPLKQNNTINSSLPSGTLSSRSLNTQQCLRASGCQCSACAVPIESLRVLEEDVSRDMDDEQKHSTDPTRETELMLSRKRFNEEKLAALGVKKKSAAEKNKPSKWRRQSEDFRAAMIAARGGKNADGTKAAPMAIAPRDPNEVPPGMVKCPHCTRNFSEESGARHIPVCKNTKAKPNILKKGSGSRLGSAKAGGR